MKSDVFSEIYNKKLYTFCPSSPFKLFIAKIRLFGYDVVEVEKQI